MSTEVSTVATVATAVASAVGVIYPTASVVTGLIKLGIRYGAPVVEEIIAALKIKNPNVDYSEIELIFAPIYENQSLEAVEGKKGVVVNEGGSVSPQ